MGHQEVGPFGIAVDGLVVTLAKTTMASAWADLDQFAWYPKPRMNPEALLKPPKCDGPLAQLDKVLLKHVITEKDYTAIAADRRRRGSRPPP